MKKAIFFLTIFIGVLHFGGFSQQAQWAKFFGGIHGSKGAGIQADAQGNVYSIGSYNYNILTQSGPVDFDPGPAVNGITPTTNGTSGFISKLNAQGDFVWARIFPISEIGGVDLQALKIDELGNLIIAGSFGGTVDFNLGPGVFNVTSGPAVGDSAVGNLFVASYASSGNFLWVKTFPCMALDIVPSYSVVNSVSCIALDSEQNILMSLNFRGRIDLDPGSNAVWKECGGLNYNAAIVKLDNQGNYVWGQHFSGGFNSSGSLATDAQSNIYVQGGIMGFVDFDPGSAENWIANYSFNDSYILKMSPLGEVSWINKIHGPYGGYGGCDGITTDREGNVLATGSIVRDSLYFRSASDSLFLLKSNAYVDSGANCFVAKINPEGHFLWIKQQASNSTLGVSGNKIQCDSLNNVYVCGQFSDSADFDFSGAGAISFATGDYSSFVLKLDSEGSFIRTNIIDGDRYVNCSDFTLDKQANIYFTGFFMVVNFDMGFPWGVMEGTGQIDFNPGPDTLALIGGGNWDETVFVAKWSQCSAGTSTLNETACNSYAWNNESYTESGIYAKSFTTALGCDSIARLDLTVLNSAQASQNIQICSGETFSIGNQTFNQTGIYQSVLSASNGCDSLVTTNLTVETVTAQISLTGNVYSALNVPADATFQWLDCESNFAPLIAEVNPTYAASENGIYALEMNAGNCSDTSECLTISNIGINNQPQKTVIIYPNPANDKLFIENQFLNSYAWQIIDARGRIIKMGQVEKEVIESIQINELTSGFYTIRIHSNDLLFTTKIQITH